MDTSYPPFAGAILRHGSHFLFIRRSDRSRHWPHYWCFPGGKIEGAESAFETARREVMEEIGVTLRERDIISTIEIDAHYSDGDRIGFLFLFDLWGGMPSNLEPDIHEAIEWYNLDELPTPIIPHVKKGFEAMLAGNTFFEYDGV